MLSSKLHSHWSVGSFASLRAFFTFKRRVSYFITATYMPAVVLVILSWCCFWISRSAVPARVTLSITTILTTILLYGAVNSNMPKVTFTMSTVLAQCLKLNKIKGKQNNNNNKMENEISLYRLYSLISTTKIVSGRSGEKSTTLSPRYLLTKLELTKTRKPANILNDVMLFFIKRSATVKLLITFSWRHWVLSSCHFWNTSLFLTRIRVSGLKDGERKNSKKWNRYTR